MSVFPTDKSVTRVDIALMACALFLQRFSFPFLGDTTLSLDTVAVVLILGYQFAYGRLLIQYDRLLWFLVLAAVTVLALLLNLKNTRLTSYGLFMVLYFFFLFAHPSTNEQYKQTLQGFQFLVLILSSLAIIQFLLQFVLDGARLIMFYGIFPDSLLPSPQGAGGTGWNTITRIGASSLIRSNGIFLVEAATMAQMAAIAILVEVLEFGRPRYLILITLALLLAYSGTGISVLIVALPLAVSIHRRAQKATLLIGLFAFGAVATGMIDISVLTSRTSEFEDTNTSGFVRFISPLWMVSDLLGRASTLEIFFGKGPGSPYGEGAFYMASANTWVKVLFEYGLVGLLVFACFLGSSFRKTRCSTPVIVGVIYLYLFTQNNLLTPSVVVIMVVLCTLSGPELRRARVHDTREYRPSLVTDTR